MSEADPTRAASSYGWTSVNWSLYAWVIRLLRWLIAFPAAAFLVAAIATGTGGSTSRPSIAFLALFSILLLGAGLSTAMYRSSGPLGHTVANGTIRADLRARMLRALRTASHAGAVAVVFVANFVGWFIPLVIADRILGDKGTSGQETTAYLLWCGCCTWLTYRLRKPITQRLAGRRRSPWPMPGAPADDRTTQPSEGLSIPVTIHGVGDAPAAMRSSMLLAASPPLTQAANDSLTSPLDWSTSVPVVTARADDHASSEQEPPPPGPVDSSQVSIKPQILNELDNTQRRAIWLLQQHQSVTVGELAGALDLRTARVAGFMHGLNRQLAALGCRCFRIETLPSGEQQYVFTLQETQS